MNFYEPGKSPMIKNLLPGLTEIGKIKIGAKGASRPTQNGGSFQLPVKLDHFVVTTLERGTDGNFVPDPVIMKSIGATAKRIPIRLLFDSIECNFQSRYAAYDGKTLWCSGDGCGAFRMKADKSGREPVVCPCGRQEPAYKGKDKCKINGTLSCIIDGSECVGGVWKFRTTGYNSTVGIMSSLAMIHALTGGLLAGLPLDLTIQPKVGTDPDGKSVTIQVVGVVFRGSIEDLHKHTLKIATNNADFRVRMLKVEETVKMLVSPDSEAIDQAGDINDEFYPEEEPVATLADPEPQTRPTAPAAAAVVQGAPVATQAAPAPATRGRGRPPKQSDAAPAPEGTQAAPAPDVVDSTGPEDRDEDMNPAAAPAAASSEPAAVVVPAVAPEVPETSKPKKLFF